MTSVTTAADVAVESGTGAEQPVDFRRRLIDGMIAAINERGFRESTVADVVRHARTSRRTFYEHFASKQDCYIALLHECNSEVVRAIATGVDPQAPWDAQIRQAVEAWIGAQSEPAVMLSWIRDVPGLGDTARQLQRETMEEFIALIHTLTDTPELRAVGITPPPRQFAIMLLGGLRELLATTVEDGGDVTSIIDVAVEATTSMLSPKA